MKYAFYLLIFLVFAKMGYSQEINSSGMIPIDVPLFTLQDGNLSLPIDMSYNSSGVKAPDKSGNVGLGWNLNAGAKIVRVVKDKVDEAFLGMDNRQIDPCGTAWHYWGYKNATFPTFGEGTQQKFYFMKDLEPDHFILFINGEQIRFVITTGGVEKNGQRIILLNESKDIFIEFLEDEYNFLQTPAEATPNYEYDIDDLIHSFPKLLKDRSCQSGYKPFATFKPYISFKVTEANGDIYYFGLDVSSREYTFTEETLAHSNYLSVNGQAEKKELHAMGGTVITSPSSWLLSKIVKPKGAIQPFNKYKLEDKFQEINFTYNRAISVNLSPVFQNNATMEHPDCSVANHESVSSYFNKNHTIFLEAQLKTIESDNFLIKFNASEIFSISSSISNIPSIIPNHKSTSFANTKREDIEGSEFLPLNVDRNIPNAIFNKESILNPLRNIRKTELVRNMVVIDKTTNKKLGYYFDYDYFVQSDHQSPLAGDIPLRIFKRLKLNGVYPIEIGATTFKLLNGHEFKYFPGQLEGLYSQKTDYWGFFSGEPNSGNSFYTSNAPVRDKETLQVINGCGFTRFPVIEFAKIATLSQIKYPTGGILEFDYELHDADNYYTSKTSTGVKNGFIKIGGLRIKSVTSFDPVTNLKTIKRYTYKKTLVPSESSGFLSIWPNFDFNDLKRVTVSTPSTGISFIDPLNSGFKFLPDLSFYSSVYTNMIADKYINGNYITYREIKVEEFGYEGVTEKSNGHTLYEFHINEKQPYAILQNGQLNFDVENPAVFGTCFSAYRYFDWNYPTYDVLKGYLKKVSIFKSGQALPIETTNYTYQITNLTDTYNIKSAFLLPTTEIDVNLSGAYKGQQIMKIGGFATSFIPAVGQYISLAITWWDALISYPIPFIDNTVYATAADQKNRIEQFKTQVTNIKLSSVKTIKYDLLGSLPIETNQTYSYGSNHSQPIGISSISKNVSTSYPSSTDQVSYSTEIKYIADYTTSSASTLEGLGIKTMKDRRFNQTVEKIIKKNTLVVGGSYIEFNDNVSLVGLPKNIYNLEILNPLSSYTMSSLSTGVTKNSNFKPQINIKQYNSKGLPIIYSQNKGPETTINYGYSQMLPTSVIVSSNFPSISKTTLYEYDSPLFGINKITNPDGLFQRIEFDNLGRLKTVRNKDNNILQSNSYNYFVKSYPNLIPTIVLQKNTGLTNVDIKTLVDNDTYEVVNTEYYNLKATLPSIAKSVVLTLDNVFKRESIYLNNTNSIILFPGNYTGFQGTVLTDGGTNGQSGYNQRINKCRVIVEIYSDVDGKGDLIGYRDLTFYIY